MQYSNKCRTKWPQTDEKICPPTMSNCTPEVGVDRVSTRSYFLNGAGPFNPAIHCVKRCREIGVMVFIKNCLSNDENDNKDDMTDDVFSAHHHQIYHPPNKISIIYTRGNYGRHQCWWRFWIKIIKLHHDLEMPWVLAVTCTWSLLFIWGLLKLRHNYLFVRFVQ